MSSQQEILLQDNFQREVDRKPVFGMLHHMRGTRLDLEKIVLHHGLDGDTFPHGIKLAPARHAMNIHLNLGPRQLVELIPRPAFFLLHFSPNTKIPCSRIEVWNWTIVQNWKF